MELNKVALMPLKLALTAVDAALVVTETSISAARMALSTTASVGLNLETGTTGPLDSLNRLTELMSDNRALGRALRSGGPIDRMLEPGGIVDRLTAPGGPLERLLEKDGLVEQLMKEDGIAERLLSEGGVVDRMTKPDGPLDRMTAEDAAMRGQTLKQAGLLERMLAPNGPAERALAEGGIIEQLMKEDGIAEKLLAENGALEKLVAATNTMSSITPNMEKLGRSIDRFQETSSRLGSTVSPMTDIAGKVAGSLLRSATSRRAETSEPLAGVDEALIVDVEITDEVPETK